MWLKSLLSLVKSQIYTTISALGQGRMVHLRHRIAITLRDYTLGLAKESKMSNLESVRLSAYRLRMTQVRTKMATNNLRLRTSTRQITHDRCNSRFHQLFQLIILQQSKTEVTVILRELTNPVTLPCKKLLQIRENH